MTRLCLAMVLVGCTSDPIVEYVYVTGGAGGTGSAASSADGVGGAPDGGTAGSGAVGATGGEPSGGSGSAPECTTSDECPGEQGECAAAWCNAGVCDVDYVPAGLPTRTQVDGDCKQQVCDGAGGIEQEPDDADAPANPNECTATACVDGAAVLVHQPAETICGPNGKHECDGDGACVECFDDADCFDASACVGNVCTCVEYDAPGTCGLPNYPGTVAKNCGTEKISTPEPGCIFYSAFTWCCPP